MQLLSTKHDPLLQELRDRTGATEVRLVKTLDLVYAEQHILSAAFGLGGKQIRYFYRVAVANGDWTRFDFEGSNTDFLRWLKSSVPQECPELWNSRLDSAPDKLPSVGEELYLHDAGAVNERSKKGNTAMTLDNAETILSLPTHAEISSSGSGIQTSELHLVHLPREMRDLSYDWLLLNTHSVYLLGHNSLPRFVTLVTSCSLPAVNRQLRAEFRDHICRRKIQVQAIILAAVNGATDLSALLANTRPKDRLCLEFSTGPSWADLKPFLEEVESLPGTQRPHITFVFRTTSTCYPRRSRSVLECLLYTYRNHEGLQFVFRQQLVLSDGAASGFTLYQTDYPCIGTPQCLRSDDVLGYIGLLLDFEKPSRGREVVEELGWDMCCFATISKNEQEALEKVLPAVGTNESGLWIVKDVGVGGQETGSYEQKA